MKFSLATLVVLISLPSIGAEIEPNNTQSQAQLLETGKELVGSVGSSDDIDFYRVNVSSSGKYNINLSGGIPNLVGGPGYRVSISDNNSGVFGSMVCDYYVDCADSGTTFRVNLDSGTEYFLRVETSEAGEKPDGQYSLSVTEFDSDELIESEPNNDIASAERIKASQSIRGHLFASEDLDVFWFELAAQNTVEVAVRGGIENVVGAPGFNIRITNENGDLIASDTCDYYSNCASQGATLTFGVLGDLPYYIQLKGQEEGVTTEGEYLLTLTLLDNDFDSVLDEVDNCPETANQDQSDQDLDGLGDVCDSNPNMNSTFDIDGDGVIRALTDGLILLNSELNWPFQYDRSQDIGSEGTRRTQGEINEYISSLVESASFDFDLDGEQTIQTDVRIFMAHQLGLRSRACDYLGSGSDLSCEDLVSKLDALLPIPKIGDIKVSGVTEYHLDPAQTSPEPFARELKLSLTTVGPRTYEEGRIDLDGFAVWVFFNSEKIEGLQFGEETLGLASEGAIKAVLVGSERDIFDLDDNPETDTYLIYAEYDAGFIGSVLSGRGETRELTLTFPNAPAGTIYPFVSDLQQPYYTQSFEPISLEFADTDGDGVIDVEDSFPSDPNEQLDTDNDGVGNNKDQDDDNDGVVDEDDALPLNPLENVDSDGDGIGDNTDPDDDEDGVRDEVDFYPLDASRYEYCCQKALIVAGGGPYFGNALWPATKNMANFAYETLLFQGLDDDDIIYLSEEESGIVDGVPSNESVRQAIIGLADSADEQVEDVLIYMVDHGGDGVFKLDEQTLLYAEDLKLWLDELHQSYDGKSTVIYDACESGSFVPLLAANDGSQRMVITSSAAKQPAVFALNGYTSFSYFFWSSFYVGFNMSDSQVLAKQAMSLIWGQDPKFDANGDGLANTKSDKVSIEDFSFGQRAVKASDNPIVGDIQLETELNGETEVAIKVVEVVGGTSVNKVLVFIDDPDFYIPLPDEPLLEANSTELSQNEDGSWSGVLAGFSIAGNYEVSVVAENKGGLFSIPDESDTVTVTQLKGRSPVIELDTDLDGLGDLTDADDDNDGVEDASDDFPLDASETVDTDGDGLGNNADADDDNDGFTDEQEAIDGTNPLSRFSCKSGCFSFDVDESLEAQPLTDGLLVIRHLFGFSGDSLTSGAVASDANRDASEVIASYLTEADSQLDIDGDGESKPLTDGLLLIRYLFGFSGDSLVSGAIGTDATRNTAEAVEAYIKERIPAN